MAKGLREQLIGAWNLVSYEGRPVDGSSSFYPMSEKPLGIIMYTPHGYMSAIGQAEPQAVCPGGWSKASPDDYKEEASTYKLWSSSNPICVPIPKA